MTVAELIADLQKCDPDASLVISGDPQVVGANEEILPRELCPTVQNLTWEGSDVIIWPDRLWGDTEPWGDPDHRPEPGPGPEVETFKLEVPDDLKGDDHPMEEE